MPKAGGGSGVKNGGTANGYGFWGVRSNKKNVLKLIMVMVVQLCDYTKTIESYTLNS